MEVWQAQLASDLNSNCYLVLMNEVLKSSWMIEYNDDLSNCTGHGELLAKAAVVGDSSSPKLSGGVGNEPVVIEIDDDSSQEDERTFLHTPPDRKQEVPLQPSSSRGHDGTGTTGEHGHNKLIIEDDPQTKVMESHEKGTSNVSGAMPDAVIPLKCAGPYQRPATIIQSPEWLPQGWTTEIRVREWGNTAGTKDKYYVDPTNGRRFRSRKEVMEYLATGHVSRWKRRGKHAEPDGLEQTLASSVAQVECLSASSQQCPVPSYAWGHLQVANNHVDPSIVSYNGNNFEKMHPVGSWMPISEKIHVLHNGRDGRGHIPQVPMKTDFVLKMTFCPPPAEIIDLEAIPDTAFSTEARLASGDFSRSNPPNELSEACTVSKGQAQGTSSSQLRCLAKEQMYKEKELHSGVDNILEGDANNIAEGRQSSKIPASHGAKSCQGYPLKGTCTYTPPILTNISYNGSDVSCGDFPSNLVIGNNGHANVTQMIPIPGFGSTLVASTPLLWHYQMFLPSFAGSHPLGQTAWQTQPPADRTNKTEFQGQVQAVSFDQHVVKDNIAKIGVCEQIEKGRSCPVRIEKLHKLKRHQEKEQLKVLGKKLCREGLAFMCKESETRP